MKELLSIELLTKTFDDLSVGVGIFQVQDLNDIESIRYVYMNKVILHEMRKTREEVFGNRIIEVAPEAYEHEGGLAVIEAYRKVAEDGKSINLGLVEYSNHLVSGTYECSAHHIIDNFVYVMLRNVTELEQKKNELEQKIKELNQYTSIVSHDLKEPLNSISSAIQLLEFEYEGKLDEEISNFLSYISDSTDRMRNLINELLDYSTLGKGKEMVTVDCYELVEIIKEDLKAKIKETKADIYIDPLPTVNGYKTELRLLFQNLISNGMKFSKPGIQPVIKISAKKDTNWVFSVRDNGIGIADEHKGKIFSIFQRLHKKSEYEGTGIGLAHCKKIVELHKGEMWLDSKPGKGSTFYFTIPMP
ncbi:sensor histidine kinase [Balneola sp. MJW-20]|uniref:sensor histidine kinase n=1 Tax=Gracilimonas aurantiaca TaxID=3234185 RepID=UPI00346620D4